jgi:hypothetical protein
MDSPSTKIAAIQAELRRLHTKQADTLEELTRSIAIKELWPEAFDHGGIARLRPNYTHVRGRRDVPKLIDLTITRGPIGENGEERVFAAEDLPPVLVEHYKRSRASHP